MIVYILTLFVVLVMLSPFIIAYIRWVRARRIDNDKGMR